MELSSLGKTWIIDIDGTLVKHNGYKIDGVDTCLEGARDFINNLPSSDMIILITSRTHKEQEMTEQFLKEENIRYDTIIYNAPYGERILINDSKPSGLKMAYSINTKRDEFMKEQIIINEDL